MNIVTPQTKTTLLLNAHYMPFAICTARSAYRHLCSYKALGLDSTGTPYSFDGRHVGGVDNSPVNNSIFSWEKGNVKLLEDQPVLPGAIDICTGEQKMWHVPTIMVCTRHFGYRSRKNKEMNLHAVYRLYKGVCQYCHEHIPYSKATKDHVYPRSLGGSNYDFNIVLACKSCNGAKDSQYPYFDKDGKPVTPKKQMVAGVFLPPEELIRKEWKEYLFVK